jgi:penicillin-binding protein 1A
MAFNNAGPRRYGFKGIFYCAVLIVVVSNILFGLDWQSAPMSPMPEIKIAASATPLTASAKIDGPNAALSSTTVVTPNNTATDNANAPVAQTPSQPKCDVSACASVYRSFRESDCTYKPSVGPRRLCTTGVVAREASDAPDAAAISNKDADDNSQSNAQCNVNACAAAYGSFNPSDCTYQPFGGPRRLCAK